MEEDRYDSPFEELTEEPEEMEIYVQGGVFKLDIYGASEDSIRKCEEHLHEKLYKAIDTIIWQEKPRYEQDRKFLKEISDSQV